MKIIYIVLIAIVIILVYVYITCPNLQFGNSCVPFFMKDDGSFFRKNSTDVIKKLKDLSSITVMCTSGLTNRIITMLSFYHICKVYKKKLNIIWVKDAACNGYFEDYFEDIDNITIYHTKTTESIFFTGQCQFNYLVNFFNIIYTPSLLIDMFKFVIPRDYIQKDLNYFINKNKIADRVGIHVRRTDFTGNFIGKIINGSNPDKEFFDFIGNESSFIATDNRSTQLLYKKHYKDRISWFRNISYSNNLRKTSIKNAIFDLYILSYCKKIKGTKNSRFSEFAKNIQKSRNIFNLL
jgi:hypothetical protein